MDDTADTTESTGDPEEDDLPDMIDNCSDSSDSDSEDDDEEEEIIAEEVEDTVVETLDEDSVGEDAEMATPTVSPVQRTSRGRIIRKPNNFVPTMTGKSHGESRDEGVNFPLVGKYQYAMRGIEDREDRKDINS